MSANCSSTGTPEGSLDKEEPSAAPASGLGAHSAGLAGRGRVAKSRLRGRWLSAPGRLDEGGAVILDCHLMSFIGIPYTKQPEVRRNDSTTLF
jgi:hypothetical protein